MSRGVRVGYMGRSSRPGATGVGRYAAGLLAALAAELPPGSVSAFLTREAPPSDPRVHELRAPVPTPTEYARAVWEQTLVPVQVARQRLDVYHSPNYILPFALRCPAVVTIHDLTYLTVRLHRLRSHLYLSVLTRFAVQRATAVVAVSEHTRQEVERQFPATRGRVAVIPPAVAPGLGAPPAAAVEAYRARARWPLPYILYVGALEPRKNLITLVRAYERAVTEAAIPHTLVLAGPRGWKVQALDAAISHSALRERIIRPGYVPEVDLACCYAAADLFVYPSEAEGFGLPPLEAMAIGTPVVTSAATALPEVVGEGAMLVNPHDVDALARAMLRVLTDAELSDHLRCTGPRRAQMFSWEASARRYADIYERVAAGHYP